MTQSIDEPAAMREANPVSEPVEAQLPVTPESAVDPALAHAASVYADAVEADAAESPNTPAQTQACDNVSVARSQNRVAAKSEAPKLRRRPEKHKQAKRPRAPAEPLPQEALPLLDRLLRTPVGFLERIEVEPVERLAWVAKILMIALVLGGAIFGAAMGAFRPGPQIAAAAVKLPLVLLLTAALSVPALSASLSAAGSKGAFARDAVLVLSSLSLTALALSALAPVVLLVVVLGASYHSTILAVVACCGLAGFAGLLLFLGALWKRKQQGCLLAAFVGLVVFGLVGSQLAWTLRPFVARPRANFEIVRSLEGSFMDSVTGSMKSAAGIYEREEAPLPWRATP